MSRSQPDYTKGVRQLRALQRAFTTGVMHPLTARQEMQRTWANGKPAKQEAAKFIKPNDRLDSFERLEIYNKQYWFRLIDCFYDDFPALRAVIGERKFYDLAVAYLRKYPSDSFALGRLGNRLEKFLAQQPQWAGRYGTLARDVVRLEYAHILAFDKEELPPLEMDALLDGRDPAKLTLTFQPYIHFLGCDYPVDDFLLTVRRREEPRGEASNAVSESVKRTAGKKIARPRLKKIWLAVHRHDDVVFYKRLEPEAFAICVALQKGFPLQAACARALRGRKLDPDFGTKLQSWFAQWASFGWFCETKSAPVKK
jgi:hypothetical protein